MRNTNNQLGIIRSIDQLGRIVLPKEIRRSLDIKDGEDLEFFAWQDGCMMLRKVGSCTTDQQEELTCVGGQYAKNQ